MPRKKKLLKQESVSICTVVSFERSSRCELKIAMAHTVGSGVTLTTLGVGRKGGTTFTPNQNLRKMLETNGTKAIEVTKENGND
jgi:enterochelin esterase-like enzyme